MDSDAELTARFGLLAAAIAGRPLAVIGTDGPAWTDGRVVRVDATRPAVDVRRQLVLQAALVRAGSLAPATVRPLVGRTALTRRYLAVEGRRALIGLTDLLPRGAIPAVDELPSAASSAAASLALARSRTPLPGAPEWFGVIKPRPTLASADALEPSGGSSSDPGLKPPTKRSIDEDDLDDEAGDSVTSSILTALSGIVGDNPLSRRLRKHLGATHGRTDGAVGSVGSSTTTVGRSASGRGVVVNPAAGLVDAEPLLLGPRLRLYPEWDEGRRAYRPDWCSVVELLPHEEELVPLDRPARHDGLRRQLAPLGLGLRRERRQRVGYDLDVDAAVEARVTAATGNAPSPDVHIDNLRRRRDLAVLVLLDASGSVNERNPGGSALYQRQRDAAAGLIDTFAILGDRVAGHAFRSQGRDVTFTRIKGFDEGFGALEMARLGGIRPGGYTRMGAAIRHAARLLVEDEATPFKLLVLLSDGFPFDTGYEGRYSEADTRQALSEARSAGVGCIGVNLGSATDAVVLERVFGTALHATAADIDVLAPSVRRLIVRALEGAQRERRVRRSPQKERAA